MIIANGTIEFLHKQGGGLDSATGFPIAPSGQWGEAIECQFVEVAMNLQAKAGGNAIRQLSWQIYVAMPLADTATEQLRLCDLSGNEVGRYSVVSVEPLRAVQQIRITV